MLVCYANGRLIHAQPERYVDVDWGREEETGVVASYCQWLKFRPPATNNYVLGYIDRVRGFIDTD